MATYTGRVKLKTMTAANWTSGNPTLLLYEQGWESDTGKMKIGDGSTAWNSLAYAIDIASLGDPGADRLVGWDDSAGDYGYFSLAGGLSIAGTVLTAGVGKQTIWVPAAAMTSRTTSGAASGTTETTTNKVMISTYDFDASADEHVQFSVTMPKSWDEGTITVIPYWSHASTSTDFGVAWFTQAVAFSNDDALDTAFGTAIRSADTGGTTDDIYVGPETAAITVAGTPAAGDIVIFQVYRDVSDASDTMAIDARLHGVKILYTADTGIDD